MVAGEFETSVALTTPKPSAGSVTSGQSGTSDSNEARFWTQKFDLGERWYKSQQKEFSHPRTVQFSAETNAIINQLLFAPPAFNATTPLSVVSGPKVSLYGTTHSSQLIRTLSQHATTNTGMIKMSADRQVGTGGYPSLCAAYRSDGRLIAVGTQSGDVRINDITTRAPLCTFSTSLPIRAVTWLRNGKNIVSGGDDGVVRLFSLAHATEGSATLELVGHGDSVRDVVVWQPRSNKHDSTQWRDIAFSASYDHTVRVWNLEDGDSEHDRCLGVLVHGEPVEALLLMPNDKDKESTWLISAGGTTLKVWNPMTGQCVSTLKSNHSKTITSLVRMIRPEAQSQNQRRETGPSWRILTGGLDGLIRIHTWSGKTGQLKHVYGVKLPHPVTAIAFNKKYTRLAIGSTTGDVIVKQVGPSTIQRKRDRQPRAGTYSFFTRGANVEANPEDFSVTQSKRRRLRSFDLALKQFRYTDALDQALETRQPQSVSVEYPIMCPHIHTAHFAFVGCCSD